MLLQFFGRLPGQTAVQFGDECRELSEAEKLELAQLAAAELKLSQSDVSFQLTDAE